jgi:hypothetical protein
VQDPEFKAQYHQKKFFRQRKMIYATNVDLYFKEKREGTNEDKIKSFIFLIFNCSKI